LEPVDLPSLDAIHLATAQLVQPGLRSVITDDERMADAARAMQIQVRTPSWERPGSKAPQKARPSGVVVESQ
jgi:hypothetical protein